MNLPSNKVAIVFILIVLFVTGTIAFSVIEKRNASTQNPEEKANVSLTLQRNTNASGTDFDSDGILDWEESLRKTNPNNADTDGDGTNDGDEVRAGRDPNTPGPNDTLTAIQEKILEEQRHFYDDYVQGSFTDKVSQNFISTYFENNQKTGFTEEAQQEFVSSLAEDAKKTATLENKYSSINIVSFVFEKEKVKNYGNKFAQIHVTLLKQLSETKNVDSVTYMNQLVNIYRKASSDLISLETPDQLVNVHLQVANNFNIVADALSILSNESRTDPLKSIFVINSYNEAAKSQEGLYTTISNYFKQNDIIFNTNEYGNFWNQI